MALIFAISLIAMLFGIRKNRAELMYPTIGARVLFVIFMAVILKLKKNNFFYNFLVFWC